MNGSFEIALERAMPTEQAVLNALGVPNQHDSQERVLRLISDALREFADRAEPRGILKEVSAADFERIYKGEGRNEDPSPLAEVFPSAELLSLFVVTVGAPLSDRISALFDEGKLALAATLDAAASKGTELSGLYVDDLVLAEARESGAAGDDSRALRYSPGYCGWDLTGQRALFEALGPEAIGIGLNDSCLMEPLKSISGVVVVGPPDVHSFEANFGFCSACRTRDCRRRIARLSSD